MIQPTATINKQTIDTKEVTTASIRADERFGYCKEKLL